MSSIYSDINKRSPLLKSRVTDLEAVYAAVDNMINTPTRQRMFRPAGIDFDEVLFELDIDTPFRIKNRIYQAIKGDARIRMAYDQTTVIQDPNDEHTFRVSVVFYVVGFGDEAFTRKGTIRG